MRSYSRASKELSSKATSLRTCRTPPIRCLRPLTYGRPRKTCPNDQSLSCTLLAAIHNLTIRYNDHNEHLSALFLISAFFPPNRSVTQNPPSYLAVAQSHIPATATATATDHRPPTILSLFRKPAQQPHPSLLPSTALPIPSTVCGNRMRTGRSRGVLQCSSTRSSEQRKHSHAHLHVVLDGFVSLNSAYIRTHLIRTASFYHTSPLSS